MSAPARTLVHSDIKPANPPERSAHYLDVPSMPWEKTKFPGIQIKVLYTDGNGITTASGLKTRDFDQILREVERSFTAHAALGSLLGGVHFELTGEDVTECIGGGISESDLDRNYLSVCDPRLNFAQALEMAFLVGRRMGGRTGPSPSVPPGA